jgi:hypothetical protein
MSTYVKGTRIRVNRKVGAFAVYNRPRVIAIVVAIVALLAGAGYVAGRVSAPDAPTTRAAAPARITPTVAAAPTPVVRVDKAAVAAAERRGFARGLARGRRSAARRSVPAGATALGALASLPVGTPYIVTRRAHGLGFKLPVVSGFLYRMCPDGRGICRRPGG